MKKYRMKPIDLVNDIWILEQHVFWFIWKWVGTGSKKEVYVKLEELGANNGGGR